MRNIILASTHQATKHFKIDRPFSTMPVITEEFTDDGIRYKKTAEGKIFKADLFDKMYLVKNNQLRKKGGKGSSRKGIPKITRKNSIKRYANS